MALLLNWLWQSGVVTAAVALTVRAAGARLSAAGRYRLWWAAVGIAVAQLLWAIANVTRATPGAGDAGLPLREPARDLVIALPDAPTWVTTLVAALLIGFIAVRSWHLLGALRWLRRTKRHVAGLPAEFQRALLEPLPRRNGARHARFVESREVRVAALLGLRDPVIALSPMARAHLSHDDLVRVAAHEYAHLDRRDDVAALVQRAVMAALGWHPAFAWLDHRLTAERECAADDWVVAQLGDPRGYARCLVRVAELAGPSRESAMALGVSTSAAWARRVERLLPARPGRWGTVGVASRALLAGVGAVAMMCLGVALNRPFTAARSVAVTQVASTPAAAPADRRADETLVSAEARPPFAREAAITRVSHRPLPSTSAPGAGDIEASRARPSAASIPAADTQRDSYAGHDTQVADALGLGHVQLPEVPMAPRTAVLSTLADAAHVEPMAPTRDPVDRWWSPAVKGGSAIGRQSARSARATAVAFTEAGRVLGDAFTPAP